MPSTTYRNREENLPKTGGKSPRSGRFFAVFDSIFCRNWYENCCPGEDVRAPYTNPTFTLKERIWQWFEREY